MPSPPPTAPLPADREGRRVAAGIAVLAWALVAALGVTPAPTPARAADMDLLAAVAGMAPGATLSLPAGVYDVPEPLELPRNATLVGAGPQTVLRLSRAHWTDFGYSFMLNPGPGGSGVRISSLTIDGNRTNHGGSPSLPPPNAGGGIRLGDGWMVTGVRFTNINYFPAWIHGVGSVSISNSTFDAEGGSTGGKDNIGGGRAHDVAITGNTFRATATGNAIDLVHSRTVTITGNTVTGSPGREHSIYLEGVRGGRVSGNTISHGSVALGTDARYSGVRRATNPAAITISDNTISDAPGAAISVTYDAVGARLTRGGGNIVSGNTLVAPGLAGVAVIHCTRGATSRPDSIVGNLVQDAFARGDESWGTGCGTVAASGIVITAGSATRIRDNRVTDSRPHPAVHFGVYLGALRARAPLRGTRVAGTSVSAGIRPVGRAD